jgi:ectoine hydroxylase-related dioxygenase (phytanoyl-CoA dioxygenase family)
VSTTSDLSPNLDDEYVLDGEAPHRFQRDGHTVVRGLATRQELDTFGPAIRAAALRHNAEQRPIAERDTYGQAFLQIPNLWRTDETVQRFVFARRFAKVAAELMGVAGVRLYHDQALFKEAGGGLTPFHQDQFYWPLDTEDTITMWMPLVDVSAEIGSMTFASGSHRLGYLGEFEISDDSEAAFRQLVADKSLPLETHGALAAGDATFHAGWTLHGAPPNPTGQLRAVMTVIYFADGAKVAEPDHAFRAHDLATWLPGVRAGELAASPLNPLLYRNQH